MTTIPPMNSCGDVSHRSKDTIAEAMRKAIQEGLVEVAEDAIRDAVKTYEQRIRAEVGRVVLAMANEADVRMFGNVLKIAVTIRGEE